MQPIVQYGIGIVMVECVAEMAGGNEWGRRIGRPTLILMLSQSDDCPSIAPPCSPSAPTYTSAGMFRIGSITGQILNSGNQDIDEFFYFYKK